LRGVARFAPGERLIHHAKHKAQFPGLTDIQYEELADVFLRRTPALELLECERKKGDVLRYDTATGEFGVLSATGIIRTYFKPVPCISLPVEIRTNCHGKPTNIDYFNSECRKER